MLGSSVQFIDELIDLIVNLDLGTGCRLSNCILSHGNHLVFENKGILPNSDHSPTIYRYTQATEEAIINSLFKAHDVTTYKGKVIKALPVDKVLEMLRAENKLPATK